LVITAPLREFPSEYNMPEEQIRGNCTSCQHHIFNCLSLACQNFQRHLPPKLFMPLGDFGRLGFQRHHRRWF
jgi:hypothetical protein